MSRGPAPVLPATGLHSYHNDSPPFSGATNSISGEPEPLSLDNFNISSPPKTGNGSSNNSSGSNSNEFQTLAHPHHQHQHYQQTNGRHPGAGSRGPSPNPNVAGTQSLAHPKQVEQTLSASVSASSVSGNLSGPSQQGMQSGSVTPSSDSQSRPKLSRVATSPQDVSLSSARSKRLVSGYMFGNPEVKERRDSEVTLRRPSVVPQGDERDNQSPTDLDHPDQDAKTDAIPSPSLSSLSMSTSPPPSSHVSPYASGTGYEDALNGVGDGEADADVKAMQAIGGGSEEYMKGEAGYAFPTHRLRRKMKDEEKIPLVIVACGSFSPPTYLHLRMFEMAKDEIVESQTFEIMAGYYSPVSSYYKKSGLAPAHHRVRMCELAVEHTSTWLMVDPWEAGQPEYQRTAVVLDHFDEMLNGKDGEGGVEMSDGSRRKYKVMLLAGGDLIESFGEPGVWSEPDLHIILGRFGCLIVERAGSDVWAFLLSHDILYHHRRNVVVIKQLIYNDISSTKVRLFVRRGMSIKYLLPNSVIQYINKNRLYLEPDNKAAQA